MPKVVDDPLPQVLNHPIGSIYTDRKQILCLVNVEYLLWMGSGISKTISNVIQLV